jgi:hypothetical protein
MTTVEEPLERKQYEKALRALQVELAPCRIGSKKKASKEGVYIHRRFVLAAIGLDR